jgi:hypothetical protein
MAQMDGKSFGISVLSSVVGSLVTATSTAIWEHVKHGSIDWIGIGALFLLTVVVFFLLIMLLRRNRPHDKPPLGSQVGQLPSKLAIHSAYYGNSPQTDADVTARLKALPREGLVISVNNNELGCDPAPNQWPAKRLRVKYSYGNDVVFEATCPEHSRMVLPEDHLQSEMDSLKEIHAGELKRLENANDVELGKTQDARKEYWDKKKALDEQGLDSLLTPLQIEALVLARELRTFADALPPYPTSPIQGQDEPNGDYMARDFAFRTEAISQWGKKLTYGFKNRDFGNKIASIYHRAGEEYDLDYPPNMLASVAADAGPSLTPYGIPKLAQEMEMIAIWINRKQRGEEDLLSEQRLH